MAIQHMYLSIYLSLSLFICIYIHIYIYIYIIYVYIYIYIYVYVMHRTFVLALSPFICVLGSYTRETDHYIRRQAANRQQTITNIYIIYTRHTCQTT